MNTSRGQRRGHVSVDFCPADFVIRGLGPCGLFSAKEWTESTRCGGGRPTPVGQTCHYLPTRKPKTNLTLERVHPPQGCADARVTSRMVDLGVRPSPLAPSAFRIDSKFDLPAAISKLRFTTTKLRPRDGPTLQWRNEFADLLAKYERVDRLHFSSPAVSPSSYATYPDANDAEAAYTA
eukprot:4375521-Prymnesium_polylepis.1